MKVAKQVDERGGNRCTCRSSSRCTIVPVVDFFFSEEVIASPGQVIIVRCCTGSPYDFVW